MVQNNCQAVITDGSGRQSTYLFPDQSTASAWIQAKAGSSLQGMWGQNAIAAVAAVAAIPPTAAIPAVPASGSNPGSPAVPATLGMPAIAAQPAVPQAWSVVYTDITAQTTAAALLQTGLARQQAGAQIIAQVYALNEANIAAGSLSPAQLTAMLEDASLATIERLLWNGSLATALSLIQASVTLPTYFSSAQITQIENAINAAIAAC